MTFIPFPEYRPDVNDYQGQHTQALTNVLPRGDGWGPMASMQGYTSALVGQCRGFFYGRKTDGSISVFAATNNRIFQLNNTTLAWTPVSKVATVTISIASPAVVTLTAHGFVAGDPVVFSTTGALPTGLTAGTVYYVISAGLAANTFEVSTTVGGSAVNTSGSQSGTQSVTWSYSPLAATDQWQFAQFGDVVIAVQANCNPQAFTLSTSTAFADLGGTPPAAKSVAVVGRFLVLTGLTSTPRRVQWSDLDGITTWTPGTGFSNFVDLPDGGAVRGAAGGEFGVIFQDSVIRRLTYVPGATPAFQIERVTEDKGLLGTYVVSRAGDLVFFLTQEGFYQYSTATGIVPIGKERVDRTVLADIDMGNTYLLIGATEPNASRVYWAYKSIRSSNSAAFDTMIAYDYILQRWSPPLALSGEYVSSVVKPGLTLEGIDGAFGSNVDALTISLDSVQSSVTSQLSAFNTSHALAFFTGSNLEATLETPEQGQAGVTVRVKGIFPRTDAATVYGSIKWRWNAAALTTATTETLVDIYGNCQQNQETTFARGKVRIPAGTTWTYCMGVEPDFTPTGKRL